MSWREIFTTQEKRFHKYLSDQAEITLSGVSLLCEMFQSDLTQDRRLQLTTEMSRLEKSGDEVRRLIITELRGTFVTPMDREDIYALSRSVDDILDYADSTVKVMLAYDIHPTPELVQMAQALKDGAMCIYKSITEMNRNADKSLDFMIAAKKLENRMEELYRKANADLFHLEDIHYIFKMREIYRHLSNAADKVDDAADLIGSILIKGNV